MVDISLYETDKLGERLTRWGKQSTIMVSEELDVREQEQLFKALAYEIRLRLLRRVTEEETVSAPQLADDDEFDVTAETIVNHLNQLESVGLLESKNVRSIEGRPYKEFRLVDDMGKRLVLEVIPDGYVCTLEDPDLRLE